MENFNNQPKNPFYNFIEKAKEFEEFGKQMNLDLQNSYKEYLDQQMEREFIEEKNYKKYEEKIVYQSQLIDNLRARVEELETDSVIKDQDIKKLRNELNDFKKEVRPILATPAQNNRKSGYQFSEPLNMGTENLSSEERALIRRISKSVENTRTNLIPKIESFGFNVSSFLSNKNTNKADAIKSKLTETHHHIEESLMQTLLTLDDVTCPPEFETARKKRREAVKYTQGLIDKIEKEIQSVLAQGDVLNELLNMNIENLLPKERALMERIFQSVEKTRAKSIPQIESFELSVSSFLSNQYTNSYDDVYTIKSRLTDTKNYIEEELMQALFTLDDIICPPEFETSRKRRREAVKYIQGLIDRVDSIKERLLDS